MSEPNFHCPKCHTRSQLIVGLTQAFCTNEADCNVFSFNPSLPDGGMSNPSEIDLSGLYKESGSYE